MEYFSENEVDQYKNGNAVEKLQLVNQIANRLLEKRQKIELLDHGPQNNICSQEEINCETYRVKNQYEHDILEENQCPETSVANENKLKFALEYLKSADDLITKTKELKELCIPSSYETVSSTSDLLDTEEQSITNASASSNFKTEKAPYDIQHFIPSNFEEESLQLKTHRPHYEGDYLQVFSPEKIAAQVVVEEPKDLVSLKSFNFLNSIQIEAEQKDGIKNDHQPSGSSSKQELQQLSCDSNQTKEFLCCEEPGSSTLHSEDSKFEVLIRESKQAFEKKIENIQNKALKNLFATSRIFHDEINKKEAPAPNSLLKTDFGLLKLVCDAECDLNLVEAAVNDVPKLDLNEILADDCFDSSERISQPTPLVYPHNRNNGLDKEAKNNLPMNTDESTLIKESRSSDNNAVSNQVEDLKSVPSRKQPKPSSLIPSRNLVWLKSNEKRKALRNEVEKIAAAVQYKENFADWLPNEIWLQIFSNLERSDLCRVSQTCSRLYHLAFDSSLWRHINLDNTLLSDGLLKFIGARTPWYIDFKGCDSTKVSNAGMRKFFQGCKTSLKRFSVDKCVGKPLLGDNVILHASCHCPNLVSIALPWTTATNDGLSALVAALSRLHDIDISGNPSITEKSFSLLVEKHCGSLRQVSIEGCFNISPPVVLRLCEEARHLTKLNVALCSKISNDVAVKICSNLPRLQYLDVHGVKSVDDRCLEALASASTDLHTLIVGNCGEITDTGVAAFKSHHMQHLDVSNCSHVTDRGLIDLTFTRLRHFDVSSTSVTSSLVDWLAVATSSLLQTFKVSYCRDVSHNSLENLIRSCPSFVSLHAYGCKQVKVSVLSKLNDRLMVEK